MQSVSKSLSIQLRAELRQFTKCGPPHPNRNPAPLDSIYRISPVKLQRGTDVGAVQQDVNEMQPHTDNLKSEFARRLETSEHRSAMPGPV